MSYFFLPVNSSVNIYLESNIYILYINNNTVGIFMRSLHILVNVHFMLMTEWSKYVWGIHMLLVMTCFGETAGYYCDLIGPLGHSIRVTLST